MSASVLTLFVYLELRLRLSTAAAAGLTDNLSKKRQSDLFWRDGAEIETCRRLDPLERCGRHTIGKERLAQGRHLAAAADEGVIRRVDRHGRPKRGLVAFSLRRNNDETAGRRERTPLGSRPHPIRRPRAPPKPPPRPRPGR